MNASVPVASAAAWLLAVRTPFLSFATVCGLFLGMAALLVLAQVLVLVLALVAGG